MKKGMARLLPLMIILYMSIAKLSAQDDKSLNESLDDLKSAFSHTKAYVLPIADTSDQRVREFTIAIKSISGVKKTTIVLLNGKTQIKVDSKLSMNELWKALPDKIRTEYTAGERKGDGVAVTPPARTSSVTAASKIEKNVYQQAEEDATKAYKAPASSDKSILQQQQDYAEEMRARDKKMAQDIYGRNRNLYFNNPDKPDTSSTLKKGEWFVEYTINGKKVVIYRDQEKLISLDAGKQAKNISCKFMVPKPFKQFSLVFTNLAFYPDVRKFEFNKPTVYSRSFRVNYDKPEFPSSQKSPVQFYIDAKIADPSGSTEMFGLHTFEGGDSLKSKNGNIESGYFEIVYFDSREDGILEAKFEFTARNVGTGWGNKKQDVIITNGRVRFRVDNGGRDSKEVQAAKAAKAAK